MGGGGTRNDSSGGGITTSEKETGGGKGLGNRNRRRRTSHDHQEEGRSGSSLLPGAHYESPSETGTTTRASTTHRHHHGRGLGKNSGNRTTTIASAAGTPVADTTTTTVAAAATARISAVTGRGLANKNNPKKKHLKGGETVISNSTTNSSADTTTTNTTDFREKDSKRRQIMNLKNGSAVSTPPLHHGHAENSISVDGEHTRVGSSSGNNDNDGQNAAHSSQSSNSSSQRTIESRDTTNSDHDVINHDAVASSSRVVENLVVANPVTEKEEDMVLPQAEYVDLEQQQRQSLEEKERLRRQRSIYRWMIIACLGVSILLPVVLVLSLNNNKNQQQPQQQQNNNSDGGETTTTTTTNWEILFLSELPHYTRQSIDGSDNNAQSKAYEWLKKDPNILTYTMERKIQRFSLAVFFFATMGEAKHHWHKRKNWLSYNHHECLWYTAWHMNIPDYAITSNCSNHTWNLELVKEEQANFGGACLHINNHTYQGEWFSLQSNTTYNEKYQLLYLPNNRLGGTLPPQIALLTDLQWIHLDKNQVTGSLPTSLGLLSNLTTLEMAGNELTGIMPTQLGLLSKERFIHLSLPSQQPNSIRGQIPTELFSSLQNLMWLDLGENLLLTGSIPTQIGLATSLNSMELYNNPKLMGPSPSQMGLLNNFIYFDGSGTGIIGTIPTQWGNLMSNNHSLKLHFNGTNLKGEIPASLCDATIEFDCAATTSGRIISDHGLCGCTICPCQ